MISDYPAMSLARFQLVDAQAHGDCHIRRQSEGDDLWLDVVHADPRILIADEILSVVSQGNALDVRLSPPPNRSPCEGEACPHVPCWTQWLLHINGRNRTVIYRIGRWVPELQAWEAAWPD